MGARAYRALRKLNATITAVCTHEDAPGDPLWFEPLSRLGRADGVPVEELSTQAARSTPACLGLVETARPDIILSAYFRSLIAPEVLSLAPRGAYNLHGSLLPRYRGRAPVNWVLVNGETETGMTLHHMTARADAGDIVGQVRLAIGPDETAPELQARLDAAAEELVLQWIPRIANGTAPRTAQDLSTGSYYGRRTPEDGRFEWTWPARRIHNLVRAVTRPFPGAFVDGPRGRTTLWRTRCLEDLSGLTLRPGEIQTSSDGQTQYAGTGAGVLEILEATIEDSPHHRT